jgi:hypothetical protein
MEKEKIKLNDFYNDIIKSVKEFSEASIEDIKLHDLRDIFEGKSYTINESFPYEFVETYQERGDGEDYEDFMIFKRKNDEKHFSLWSYRGKIEEDVLYETVQVEVKVKKWKYI